MMPSKSAKDSPAIARQYIRSAQEDDISATEMSDPIGDDVHSPVRGIVHRYPDRALYKVTNICAMYCRYCFRKGMIGVGSDHLRAEDHEQALDYLRQTPAIWELILTGGDPLVLSAKKLGELVAALDGVKHIQVLRLHTRVPLQKPEAITDDLCAALARTGKTLYIALHVNHKDELTPEVRAAVQKLRNTGAVLLSQSVLLRGVNDDGAVLEDLFRALVVMGVKPYYLHHLDFAKGTSHFRVPIEEGQAIMRDLQGRISGLCLPQYTLDIPGGHGKVPLTPIYIAPLEKGAYEVTDYNGDRHRYP